ncbi:MAG: glycerate kinase, partial [Ilumatobacteraceae bacterium]
MRVLAAVDKFRGTASAHQAAKAIADACWTTGHDCIELPMADGGEGTLAALGGANQLLRVEGPLGAPVDAPWRFHRGTAVIEMALASGLHLVGGAEGNDAIAASTIGTGQLIDAALNLGAERIIVCLGGSATTDGGLGAVSAVSTPARLKRVEFVVACDVGTPFLDAAEVFAPQKGATPAQVKFLVNRLAATAERYRQRFGVDVTQVRGGGAAGGLAGGLFALGATLVPGFDVVADELGLYDAVVECDVIVTGEGRLDATSFHGKVVGGVAE